MENTHFCLEAALIGRQTEALWTFATKTPWVDAGPTELASEQQMAQANMLPLELGPR